MFCPKCEKSEDIKFFIRHMKTSEDDESTIGNCLTILHADPECGYNQSMMLDEVVEVVFRDWSELGKLEERMAEINNNAAGFGSMLGEMMGNMVPNDIIETNGEVVEDNNELPESLSEECESCMLPPIQEEEEFEESDDIDG